MSEVVSPLFRGTGASPTRLEGTKGSVLPPISRLPRAGRLAYRLQDERIFAGDNRDSLAESLRACLQEYEPEAIREVSVTLLATFAGLLANVVGDRLTWSLLEQIWPDALLSRTGPEETEK